MYISGYIKESINEGDGLRSVVFISGCQHNCKGCHSPQTHNFDYGEEFTKDYQLKIISDIKNNPLLDGITLCGGDPFFSSKDVLEFVKLLKSHIPNINIWSYTGFTFEEILQTNNSDMINLLKEINILIDGRYINAQRDLTLRFKGSSNQRIVDVKQSFNNEKTVELI